MQAEPFHVVALFLDALDEGLDIRAIERQAAKAGLSKYKLRNLVSEHRERVWQAASKEVQEFASAHDALREGSALQAALVVEIPPKYIPLKVRPAVRLTEAAVVVLAGFYKLLAVMIVSLPKLPLTKCLFIGLAIVTVTELLPALYNYLNSSKRQTLRQPFQDEIQKINLPALSEAVFQTKKAARHAVLTKGVVPELQRLIEEAPDGIRPTDPVLDSTGASGVQRPYDLFLSYDPRDRRVVLQLYRNLVFRGLRPWLDYEDLLPGQKWQEMAEALVNRLEVAAVLVGAYKPWDDDETEALLRHFLTKGRPVITVAMPLLYGSIPNLPEFLKTSKVINLRAGMDGTALDRLVHAISQARTNRRTHDGLRADSNKPIGQADLHDTVQAVTPSAPAMGPLAAGAAQVPSADLHGTSGQHGEAGSAPPPMRSDPTGPDRALRVFLSYSWDSEEHRSWVRTLGEMLQVRGIEVRLDQWLLKHGQSLTQFMEEEVMGADYVLFVCTPTFAQKANARRGGAGYEQQIVTGRLLTGADRSKFIALLREGTLEPGPQCAVPTSLTGTYLIDLTPLHFASGFEELVRTLKGQRPHSPPASGEETGSIHLDASMLATPADSLTWAVSEILNDLANHREPRVTVSIDGYSEPFRELLTLEARHVLTAEERKRRYELHTQLQSVYGGAKRGLDDLFKTAVLIVCRTLFNQTPALMSAADASTCLQAYFRLYAADRPKSSERSFNVTHLDDASSFVIHLAEEETQRLLGVTQVESISFLVGHWDLTNFEAGVIRSQVVPKMLREYFRLLWVASENDADLANYFDLTKWTFGLA